MSLKEFFKDYCHLTWTSTKKSNDFQGSKKGPVLDDACLHGSKGLFTGIKNDFTLQLYAQSEVQQSGSNEIIKSSSSVKKPKEKFRFVIGSLAVFLMALCFMARVLLNVSIVEMTKPTSTRPINSDVIKTTTLDLQLDLSSELATTSELDIVEEGEQQELSDELQWTAGEQNLLLASFYIGYAPTMMFSGSLADKYGAKYPLFFCGLGSSLVSLLTPFAARYSLPVLIALRIVLGMLQAAVIPASYDLFNRWLTLTETSLFVPLIRVNYAVGSLIGAALPGIILHFGFEWPCIFYAGSFICALWCFIWLPLASSSPHTNKFVSAEEYRWIVRKKKQEESKATTTSISVIGQNAATKEGFSQHTNSNNSQQKTNQTPWLLIITDRSVISLTLVKLTYNLALDFVVLELAFYLRQVHSAPMDTISTIASIGSVMQALLITLVGWTAKVLVQREALGLSRTKWRKVFQSGANLSLALIYLALSMVGSNLKLATCLFMAIYFLWMLGAGGEAMAPFDLSAKYPATIVGIAQSVSVLSGLTVPALCGLVLGEQTADLDRWRTLFLLIAGSLAFGGLVFAFFFKAKPFLPGERAERSERC